MQRVVVIGAGIAGASTFFALARRGAEVTLVDDGADGQATAASAGIIQPWASTGADAYVELYMAGAAHYPELLSQLAAVGITRTDYRRSGGLIVHRDPAQLDIAQGRIESRRSAHGEAMGRVERIGGARARTLFPPLAEGFDALFIEGGGRVDGRTLRDALIDGGRALGGVVRRGTAILGESTQVVVDGETLSADAVVVASGAWTGALLDGLGLESGVRPQRGQITHLRVEGVDTSGWPSVFPLSHHYLVAFDSGRVAVGATRESEAGFDARVTAQGQLQVLQDALAVAPGLADATVIETRVGLRPLADDGVPIVGALPGRPGLFVATGYGAGGLTMGPLLGDLLAREIAGDTDPMLRRTAPRSPASGG